MIIYSTCQIDKTDDAIETYYRPMLAALHAKEPFTNRRDQCLLEAIDAFPSGILRIEKGVEVKWGDGLHPYFCLEVHIECTSKQQVQVITDIATPS